VTEARFSILTNGIVYWFYTDLEAPNRMDERPFFEFSLLDIRDAAVAELKKFSKSAFDLSNILTTASELKYTREITRYLAEQMLGTQSTTGSLFVARILTTVTTLRMQQRDVLDFLTEACAAANLQQNQPSLLPVAPTT
jgi:hypothetical protein